MKTARELSEIIMEVQRRSAELMLHAGEILAENKTGRRDVVTEYDRRIQAFLMDELSKAVPEAGFFCEENGRQGGLDGPCVFIIDPIDGTMNFVHGFKHSCVSVACASFGQLVAGAVYNPYAGEMFSAWNGGGAFLNGRPIHVSREALENSVVCCGTAPYAPELTERSFELMERVFRGSLDIRRQGSAALDLCSVAAGRAGAYFEMSVSLWDWAAGGLIVREAGGLCTDLEGAPLPLSGRKTSILAAGPQAGTELARLIRT